MPAERHLSFSSAVFFHSAFSIHLLLPGLLFPPSSSLFTRHGLWQTHTSFPLHNPHLVKLFHRKRKRLTTVNAPNYGENFNAGLELCVRCSASIRFDRFTSPAFAFLGSLDIFIQPTKQILFPLWWDVKVRRGRLKWVHMCTVGLWTQMVVAERKKDTSRSMCGEGRTHHILLFETRALILTRTHVYTVCYKVWVHFRS